MKKNWRTIIFVLIGAVALLGPSAWILQKSRNEFASHCAALCNPYGMDYKIVPLGYAGGYDKYPARCDCVVFEPKRWWQFWKSDPPRQRAN